MTQQPAHPMAQVVRLGYTVGEPTATKLARAKAMRAEHIGVSGQFVTPELVAHCRSEGLQVCKRLRRVPFASLSTLKPGRPTHRRTRQLLSW